MFARATLTLTLTFHHPEQSLLHKLHLRSCDTSWCGRCLFARANMNTHLHQPVTWYLPSSTIWFYLLLLVERILRFRIFKFQFKLKFENLKIELAVSEGRLYQRRFILEAKGKLRKPVFKTYFLRGASALVLVYIYKSVQM